MHKLRFLDNLLMCLWFYCFPQKYGILGHEQEDDTSTYMTFYTTLISMSQIAIRLENAVSLLNAMTNSSIYDNSTYFDSSNNNTTDDVMLNSTSDVNSTSINETYSYKWLELQALSAVVRQVVTDACKYVS